MDYLTLQHAQKILNGVAHRTPVLTSRMANEAMGCQVFFKCENFQRAGAFKFRGAYFALSQLPPKIRKRGVITYSSGNHAQAIALAANLWQCPATIVAPTDAPKLKMEATKAYGGEVILYDRFKEDREAIAQNLALERDLTIIPPFDHPHIIAGQGTCASEFFDEVGDLDILLVPLGGGGLLAGSCIAARQLSPNCKVIGVEPEMGNDGQQSLSKGHIVRIATPKTIADGAQTQQLGALNFEIIKNHVSEIITVSDEEIKETMRFLAMKMKIIVEPTGCLAAAAALFHRSNLNASKKKGMILSGGNIDQATLKLCL